MSIFVPVKAIQTPALQSSLLLRVNGRVSSTLNVADLFATQSVFKEFALGFLSDGFPPVQDANVVSWNPGLLRRKSPNLYIKIEQDGSHFLTMSVIKRDLAPEWNEDLNL
jgi:hypothetical protein